MYRRLTSFRIGYPRSRVLPALRERVLSGLVTTRARAGRAMPPWHRGHRSEYSLRWWLGSCWRWTAPMSLATPPSGRCPCSAAPMTSPSSGSFPARGGGNRAGRGAGPRVASAAAEVTGTARALGVDAAPQVLVGDPGPELCRLAAAGAYDVIVVGSHGSGFQARPAGLGESPRVAPRPCPVLVVRAAEPPGDWP